MQLIWQTGEYSRANEEGLTREYVIGRWSLLNAINRSYILQVIARKSGFTISRFCTVESCEGGLCNHLLCKYFFHDNSKTTQSKLKCNFKYMHNLSIFMYNSSTYMYNVSLSLVDHHFGRNNILTTSVSYHPILKW